MTEIPDSVPARLAVCCGVSGMCPVHAGSEGLLVPCCSFVKERQVTPHKAPSLSPAGAISFPVGATELGTAGRLFRCSTWYW